MKNSLCIAGLIIIFLSSVLGHLSINIFFPNTNLAGEYPIIVGGFILSFMLIGTLLFIAGLKSSKK